MSSSLDPDSLPQWLSRAFAPKATLAAQVLAGVNEDDCGVVPVGDGLLVATTDFLNSRPIATHFGLGGPYGLGRLVVTSSLSDLCGSGARPLALLVGLMARRDMDRGEAEEIFRGAAFEADRWGVPVVGGDTKLGDGTALMAVAIGFASSRSELFLMSAAEADQDLFVSGPIGGCSAAVLALSEAEDEDALNWATKAIIEPNLPLDRSEAASRLRLSAGGTDISDGLAADLHAMCRASNVGAEVHIDALPLEAHVAPTAERLGVHPASLALVLGGDFQFVLSAPSRARADLEGIGMAWIGRTTRDGSVAASSGGRRVPLSDLGHRDGRRLPFAEEVRVLVGMASEQL